MHKYYMTSNQPFDLRLAWGKSRGLSGGRKYPLEGHLIDAAACATWITENVLSGSQRHAMADGLGMDVDRVGSVAGLVAGWHDIGKLAPTFQSLEPAACKALTGAELVVEGDRIGHAEAGYWHLLDRFGRSVTHDVYPDDAGARLAQVVGGHHGIYPNYAVDVYLDGLHGTDLLKMCGPKANPSAPRWAVTRDLMLSRVEDVIWGGSFDPLSIPSCNSAASVLLSGVTVMADWLVSQVEAIDKILDQPEWCDGQPAQFDVAFLRDHHVKAVERAEALVTEAGLTASSLGPRPFALQFPGYTTRGAQQVAVEKLPELVTGPGLFIVMAPTGDGKTEAALHAASVLAGASDCPGVLLALPTMATTDAMYARLKDFAGNAVDGPASVSLMHSQASLNEEYRSTRRRFVTTPRISTECGGQEAGTDSGVTAWLQQSGRGLLAPHTVCTVDQLLKGAIVGQHTPLKMTGASRKVVVIDEAHSYDTYMHGLLCRSLTWLANLGSPVVILSATLSEKVARDLAKAYISGLGKAQCEQAGEELADLSVAYPGWVHVDAGTAVVSSGVIPPTGRERSLTVKQIDYVPATDGEGKVRSPQLANALAGVVSGLVSPVATGERDGNVLVVCNTVTSAVATYESLKSVANCEVLLMHSRFPSGVRTQHAEKVDRMYGKRSRTRVDGNDPVRPVRSILVATQVVEQSLDLDMDWVISELAPAALLLQRAGRGHRHQDFQLASGSGTTAATVRPVGMETPVLTVLSAVDDSGRLINLDARPYDQTLLTSTREVLRPFTLTPLRVPEDVQQVVNAVYDREFTEQDEESLRAYAKNAKVRRDKQSAAMEIARIPSPQVVGEGSLQCLTNRVDQDIAWRQQYSTRYDIDSVTVLPVWDVGGRSSLDESRFVSIPGESSEKLTRHQLRTIVRHSISTPGGWWAKTAREDLAIAHPKSWAGTKSLRGVLILPFTDRGATFAADMKVVTLHVSAETGLTTTIERKAHA